MSIAKCFFRLHNVMLFMIFHTEIIIHVFAVRFIDCLMKDCKIVCNSGNLHLLFECYCMTGKVGCWNIANLIVVHNFHLHFEYIGYLIM